ncbi:hypothetical protein Tco_1210810 [Tanacetum coccineum]
MAANTNVHWPTIVRVRLTCRGGSDRLTIDEKDMCAMAATVLSCPAKMRIISVLSKQHTDKWPQCKFTSNAPHAVLLAIGLINDLYMVSIQEINNEGALDALDDEKYRFGITQSQSSNSESLLQNHVPSQSKGPAGNVIPVCPTPRLNSVCSKQRDPLGGGFENVNLGNTGQKMPTLISDGSSDSRGASKVNRSFD